MVIDKNFEGLHYSFNIYSYNGDLEADEIIIELDRSFLVRGNVKSKHNIKTKWSLYVEGNIEVGGDIISKKSLTVEGSIITKGSILVEESTVVNGNILVK